MVKFFLKGLLTGKPVGNKTLKIDDRILKKAPNIARKKRIFLDAMVDQKLKEFIFAHQKTRLHGQG